LYLAYLYHFTNGKFTLLKPELLMKGLLKSKSPGSQFLLVIGISIVSLFIFSLLGTVILARITDMKLMDLSDISKWDYSKPEIIFLIRGLQVVQFIGLFLIPTFVCARLFSTSTKKYLGFKGPSNGFYFLIAVVAMIVAIPLVNWLGELNKNVQFPDGIEDWMKSSEADAAKTVNALLSKHTIKDLILNIIFIAGLAAVGEELLFRGMVQRLLIKMFRNPWPGIIIAALLFSAMHMQFYGFLPRFALGILLGAIYWYSGSLWTAMLAHFVYDALVIVLVYFNPEMLKEEQPVTAANIALIGSISFVMVVLLIEWMRKKTTTTYTEVYADDDIPVKDHPF
jgi:membrane protease YdiL (CAAX protease family)